MGNGKHNILIVMHGAGLGGVENSLKILCKYLDKGRFQPAVALPVEGPFKDYVDGINIKTIITPIDTWTPIPFHFGERHYYQFLSSLKERVRALTNIIKENSIDVVHSSSLSVADGALAARLAGKPHVWHIHGKSVGSTSAYGSYLPVETLYALVKNLSQEIVAVSDDVAGFLKHYQPDTTTPVIYNGLDIKEFDTLAASPSSVREEFGLVGKRLVTLVGRVAPVKGIDDYVESARKVVEARDDTVFLMVGPDQDTELAERLKNRIRSMKLTDRIVFTGRRNDIPAILRESDVFVCSSVAEGFPYSVLEAMAAAKPVVTTRCGGPEEIVIHGETGFHVDLGRPDQIAEAIVSLLDDVQLVKRMGRRSREVVEQKFSAEAYARNFEDVYARLCNDLPPEPVSPWGEVMLDLVSTIGALGTRTRQLEHEVRDLRSFESSFKDNFLYRGLKKLMKSFRR